MKQQISKEKIKVIYNFLDQKNEVEKLPRKNDTITIGVLANFTEAKGHSFLIEAFRGLVATNKEYRLILAGDGELRNMIESKIENYSLTNYVDFLGYITDNSDFFSRIDMLIVPSKNETFGRVILESMQSDVPVIATNIGGIPEIITNGYNGLLINYGDKKALKSSILLISENNSIVKNLIINANKKIKKKFSSESYFLAMDEVFRKIDGVVN